MPLQRCFPIVCCLAIAGCASLSKKEPDPTRQPWRDSNAALPAAKAGDAEGLRRSFAAARAQLMLPYINGGEDAEAMFENMTAVLQSNGDDRFQQALAEESPETRSALREFLSEESTRHSFPKTHAMLADAPEVEWPSDLAMKRFYQESGETLPPKIPWKKSWRNGGQVIPVIERGCPRVPHPASSQVRGRGAEPWNRAMVLTVHPAGPLQTSSVPGWGSRPWSLRRGRLR